MEEMIPLRLSILGHPQRLAVFRLLMRRYPDQVPAGEISVALNIKSSTLSSYLSALMQAGLVKKTRQGTWLRYQVDLDTTRETLDALYLDCCRGRPDLCSPFHPPMVSPEMTGHEGSKAHPKYNVLFLCTGNSARSIFAESILNSIGRDRFAAYSAGTQPQSRLNPIAVEMLQAKGYATETLRPKGLDEFIGEQAPSFDFVFTVCDQAANEECPTWEGQPVSAHWGMPDPVKASGTTAERSLAFHQAYGVLQHRLQSFTALPFAQLDQISLQRAVDKIAHNLN